jgi:hypothetical protein
LSKEKQAGGRATAWWNSNMQDLAIGLKLSTASMTDSVPRTNRAVMRRLFACQLPFTCVLPPIFPVYDPKEL